MCFKNRFRTLAALLALAAPLSAQFQGLKIMVNPGHGGHDSDDRYIPATGFWESEGNLTKGLYLRDLLRDRGAQVIMSRTQNRTEDDLRLSDIDAIANQNQVDFFHAIHSNGYDGNSNYTLMLWKEVNGQPAFPEAREMGEIMAAKIQKVNRTTDARNKGDMSFLGFNLGVLRTLTMPGTLSEGSFHDYIPESWRLQNLSYRKHEAVAIMRSFLSYYRQPADTFAVIAGVTRDKTRQVSYNYIGSLPNDKYKPINNIRVRLFTAGDSLLDVYNGDFNNNGFYFFDSLRAGDYKVIIDYGAFKPDTIVATVAAGKSTFFDRKPAAQSDLPPQVFAMAPRPGEGHVDPYAPVTLTFSQSMDDSTEAAIAISPARDGRFSWMNNRQVVAFYPDSAWRLSDSVRVSVSTLARNSSKIPLNAPFYASFETADSYNRPYVKKSFPTAGDSITIYKNVSLTFSQKMIAQKVLGAITITPAVGGSWQVMNDSTRFVFRPDSLWNADTPYRISVAPGALNTFQIGLNDTFRLDFKTQKRNALIMLSHLPADGAQKVSFMENLLFYFDGVVNGYSARDFITVTGPRGDVRLKAPTVTTLGDRSVMTLRPYRDWALDADYTVLVRRGLMDVDSLTMPDSVIFHFRTQPEGYVSSTLLEDFSAGLPWRTPAENPLTRGVIDSLTLIQQSAQQKISTIFSLRLQYAFSADSGGVCVLDRDTPLAFAGADSTVWGAWVYGDGSMNRLAFRLKVGADTVNYSLGRIDWSGWRFTGGTFDSVGANAFDLIGIRLDQASTAYDVSALYFDDFQSDVVSALDEGQPLVPLSTALLANYPNPFNPATVIPYRLAEQADVRLRVFDVLGRVVYDWRAKRQAPGSYRRALTARGWASGVYFYQLEVKSQGRPPRYFTRKLLLLK